MTGPVFVDTSAFYALMDSSDQYHEQAKKGWNGMLMEEVPINTSNYVTVETGALLQSRLGFEAADLWYRDILGVVDILWIDERVHQTAYELWLSLGRRNLSLVDCASFVIMRGRKIETIFGYDRHFDEQGFTPVGRDGDRN
jgi:predicted nucleic acid-binding protein